MAKVSLTKLGLKPNAEIKVIEWNGQEIEVKQYLPMEAKIGLISEICSNTVDDNSYINWARFEVYLRIETILAYTNINVTEKQKEDILKLYDMFAAELGDKIYEAIPTAEIEFVDGCAQAVLEGVYKHKNSAVGIMEAITSDYSALDLDATEIQKKIGDPSNLELLKAVLGKLG